MPYLRSYHLCVCVCVHVRVVGGGSGGSQAPNGKHPSSKPFWHYRILFHLRSTVCHFPPQVWVVDWDSYDTCNMIWQLSANNKRYFLDKIITLQHSPKYQFLNIFYDQLKIKPILLWCCGKTATAVKPKPFRVKTWHFSQFTFRNSLSTCLTSHSGTPYPLT